MTMTRKENYKVLMKNDKMKTTKSEEKQGLMKNEKKTKENEK